MQTCDKMKKCLFFGFPLAIMLLIIVPFFALGFGEVMYYDDFSHGKPITDDATNPESNPYWTMTAFTAYDSAPIDDGTGNMIWSCYGAQMHGGSLNWYDYETEIRFRLEKTNYQKYRMIWLCPRYVNGGTKDYFRAELHHEVGDGFYFQIKDVAKGPFPIKIKLGSTPWDILGFGWHTFSTRVIGNQMISYLDGEEILGSRYTMPSISSPSRYEII